MWRTVRIVLIASVLMACAVVAPVLLHFSSLCARVYEDRRLPALSRYALEPTPSIVLVGSSMTFRLYEGYFKAPLRNIATSGGSPLTGLAILASYPSLPHVVLVAMNVMSRKIERDLVEQFGKNDAAPFGWFKPYRAVISWAYYWLKLRSENVNELIAAAPSTYDISASLNQAASEFAGTSTDEPMAAIRLSSAGAALGRCRAHGRTICRYCCPGDG